MTSMMWLLLLFLVREWQAAEADCQQNPCEDAEGIKFKYDCKGGNTNRASQKIDCDNEITFTSEGKNETWYHVINTEYIIITAIDIEEDVCVTITHLTDCYNNCIQLSLGSNANCNEDLIVMLKDFKTLRNNRQKRKFRIKTSGRATIKFKCVEERQCAQMEMSRMKRVVDGAVATQHEFPFIVRLTVFYTTYSDGNNFADCNSDGFISFDDTKENCANNNALVEYRCGGSILNDNYVLTAQHCVPEEKTEEINGSQQQVFLLGILVYAGDHDTTVVEAEETLHWVIPANVERAPNYNVGADYNNDVALLEVSPTINLDKDYRYPICLAPTYMDELTFLDDCTVKAAGWGLTAPGVLATELNKGDFTVISNADCVNTYGAGRITDKMICMDHDSTVTCSADSGGPVFCKSPQKYFYQVGVISFGEPDTTDPAILWDNDFPDVNARVTKFVAWIEGIVGAANLP